MSDCFVLYLLLTCMKKKTSGADKFTNNNMAMAAAHKWCSLFFERKIMQHFQNLVYNNKYGKHFLCAFSF